MKKFFSNPMIRVISVILLLLIVVGLVILFSGSSEDSDGLSKDSQNLLDSYSELEEFDSANASADDAYLSAFTFKSQADPAACIRVLKTKTQKTEPELELLIECSQQAANEAEEASASAELAALLKVKDDAYSLFRAAELSEKASPAQAKNLYTKVLAGIPEPATDEERYFVSESKKRIESL